MSSLSVRACTRELVYFSVALIALLSLFSRPVQAQEPPYEGCSRVSKVEYEANLGLHDARGRELSGEYRTSTRYNPNGDNTTYYWYCPPREAKPHEYLGMVLSLAMMKPTGWQKASEYDLFGNLTNRFYDSKDPLGAGFSLGYNFAPWNNNIIVGPYVSLDWYKLSVNHVFPAGTFLGTTSHWAMTAGTKVGVVTTPGIFVYGLIAAAWVNQRSEERRVGKECRSRWS